VGRFFLEHPRFIGGIVVPARPDLSVGFYTNHRVGEATTVGYLALTREVQRSEELVDVQIRIEPAYEARFERALASADVDSARSLLGRTDEGDLGRDIQNVLRDLMSWRRFALVGAPLPLPYPEVVSELMDSTRVERQSLIPGLLGDVAGAAYSELSGRAPLVGLRLSTRFEPAPNPSSRVVLVGDRDQVGMRKIGLTWRLSDLDKHSVRRTLELLGDEVGRSSVGRLKLMFEEEGPWPPDIAGGWHLMGTTRMADSERLGVVDKDCRVHGMSNLYVAGSSVFPTAGSGTPTLTLIALALRLASRLRGILS
jgi:choline dehydrogenase-like flavoprotein